MTCAVWKSHKMLNNSSFIKPEMFLPSKYSQFTCCWWVWRKVNFGVCAYCSAVSLCYHWCPDCVPTLIPAEGLAPGAELIQLGSRYETSWQIPVSQRERDALTWVYICQAVKWQKLLEVFVNSSVVCCRVANKRLSFVMYHTAVTHPECFSRLQSDALIYTLKVSFVPWKHRFHFIDCNRCFYPK